MYFDERFENNIMLENISRGFSQEERNQLVAVLNENDIGVVFFEKRSIEMSIFQTLCIYVNQNLTDLIIAGLLAPAAYDALKNSICFVVQRISSAFGMRKKNEPVTSLKLRTENAEIIVPIPNNLSNEQFELYMNMLQNVLSEANEPKLQKVTRYETFIVDADPNTQQVILKTVQEYGYEQAMRQQQNRENTDSEPPSS